jgi:hypothetical protein
MVIVGGESFAIDRISNQAGRLGFIFLGGKKGEILVQYSVSAYLTNRVMPTTTYWLFDQLNLGLPIDIEPIVR